MLKELIPEGKAIKVREFFDAMIFDGVEDWYKNYRRASKEKLDIGMTWRRDWLFKRLMNRREK